MCNPGIDCLVMWISLSLWAAVPVGGVVFAWLFHRLDKERNRFETYKRLESMSYFERAGGPQ